MKLGVVNTQEVDGISVVFHPNDYRYVGLIATFLALGAVGVWTDASLGMTLAGTAVLAGVALISNIRRVLKLTPRALTITSDYGGTFQQLETIPLEAIGSVELESGLLTTRVRFEHTDGTVSHARLGRASDHQQVVDWLRSNLERVQPLEDKPADLIPIELAKLSKAAVKT